MSQFLKRDHQRSSNIFAQANSKEQNPLPWYCTFCYNQIEHQQMKNIISRVDGQYQNKLQTNKVRHSLKRSANNNEDIPTEKKNIKTQINVQNKQTVQSLKFSNKLDNFGKIEGRHIKSYQNNNQFRIVSNNQNMGSGLLYKKYLPFQSIPLQNSIKMIRTTPPLNICNINLKNDKTVTKNIPNCSSIKFTAGPKSALYDTETLLNYDRDDKVEMKQKNRGEWNNKDKAKSSTCIPILQKIKFSFSQLQMAEEQLKSRLKNPTSNSKIKQFKSDNSTKQDIDSTNQGQKNELKLVSSVESLVQFNILPPIKKIQKKCSLNSSGDIKSSLSQIGVKTKIGIRKVQSIVSNQDQDQFSEVIYGQRNFLMPQIHQVEELSRVSSHESLDIKGSLT